MMYDPDARHVLKWKSLPFDTPDYPVHDDIHDADLLLNVAPVTIEVKTGDGSTREDWRYLVSLVSPVSPVFGDVICQWLARDLMTETIVYDNANYMDLLFMQDKDDDVYASRFRLIDPDTGALYIDFELSYRDYALLLGRLYEITHDEHGYSVMPGMCD